MGRPLNPRYFGATADSSGDINSEENLSAIVKVGSNSISYEGIIISQRSNNKFRVNDMPDKSGNTGVCKLVNKVAPGDDEMAILGTVNGSGKEVNIRKVHNRTMIDFDNNRYTWEIQDDSTTNTLVLFEI